MAGRVQLQELAPFLETGNWLRTVAPDFAPDAIAGAMEVRGDRPPRYAADDAQILVPQNVHSWARSTHCYHRDSNFWFWMWMWAMNSGTREVHHHHYDAPGAGGGRDSHWDSAPGAGIGNGRRRSGGSGDDDSGMTGGQRVVAGAVGAVAVAGAVHAFGHFTDQEAELRESLGRTQALRRRWKQTDLPQEDSETRHTAELLMRVINAQEKVEQTRVSRASTYKWSAVVVGIGGVALVVGALINFPELVIIGAIVAAVALAVIGVTWLVSCIKDDRAPAKKVANDYQTVALQFLAPSAPPAYEETDRGREAEVAVWTERAGSTDEPYPTYREIEARIIALRASQHADLARPRGG